MDPKHEASVAYFQMKLKIDPNDLDRELMEHAPLYFEVCEQMAFADSRAASAKDALARREANLYGKIAAQHGGVKHGMKGTIEAEILLHPRRQEAFESHLAAELEAAQWRALRDAFSARSYALRDLCALQLAGHFQSQSVRTGQGAQRESASERNMEAHRKQRAAGRNPLDE